MCLMLGIVYIWSSHQALVSFLFVTYGDHFMLMTVVLE